MTYAVAPEPPADCGLCPRLVAYRSDNQHAEPAWFNGAVPSFGAPSARLLIVGLAPGRGGANRTGRPFTGDYAGDLLYETLLTFGFAEGSYRASPDDGLQLRDCMITNAVRCVPPANKPVGEEIATCRRFFSARMGSLPDLAVILALGRIAHDQTLSALGLRKTTFAFGHGARHDVGQAGRAASRNLSLYDSYHCSRYNTNTRRLTEAMFHDVFVAIRQELDQDQTRPRPTV